MTLYEKIMTIYPDLEYREFKQYILLQNDLDDKGDYIAKWEHPTLARPTESQLN